MLIPVFGCAILTATAIMGMGRVFTGGAMILRAGDFGPKAAKMASLAIIEITDLFLVGTVAYITAAGLYKLFIMDREVDLLMARKINNLKDLENKIIGVIVAALAVAFLGQAAGIDVPEELLSYGGGIALVIAALVPLFLKSMQVRTRDKGEEWSLPESAHRGRV